ncbi:MAG: hypothetical protein IJN88_02880, partial [Clostridia bacterium]|nr:hypothetical protein [Clostridia bacterium]
MAESKKKKRPQKRHKSYPPLSKTDKFIYSALEVAGAVFVFTFLYKHDSIIGFFILKSADVLSFQERFTIFFIVPFIFFYLFYILDSQYSKKPIFGNKKVDYYNTLNHKFILPLFDKRYNNIARNSRNRRKQLINFGIVCFVSIILFTFGILGCHGRHEFSRDGITTYSIFNNVIEEYSYDEVESYHIEAYYRYHTRTRGLGHTDYDINLTVRFTDGENFTASYNTSRDIYALEEIDKILKDKEKTLNSRNLELVIDKYNFTDDELKVI